MSDIEEEEYSDDNIEEIFGESDEEEEFESFNFQLPDDLAWLLIKMVS